MQVTVKHVIDTLDAIGKERAKVVDELTNPKLDNLSENAEKLLETHLEKLNSAYDKLLSQVKQYQICV